MHGERGLNPDKLMIRWRSKGLLRVILLKFVLFRKELSKIVSPIFNGAGPALVGSFRLLSADTHLTARIVGGDELVDLLLFLFEFASEGLGLEPLLPVSVAFIG